MSKQEHFERILTSLHATALDDTEWSPTSRMIDEFCESQGNFLVFCDGDLPQEIDVFFSRLCYRGQRNEELEREYFEVYHPVDERIPRIRQLPDSQIVSARSLFTEQEIKHSRVYNESMLRSRAGDSLSVRLDGPQDSRIVWSIGDPVGDDGWSSAQVDAIGRLLPHLRQFLGFRHALAEARALGSSLSTLLDTTHSGLLQLDRRGRIATANDCALEILRQGDGLTDERGFLRALALADDDALQRLLALALPSYGEQPLGGSMTVRRPSLRPPFVVYVSPVGVAHMRFLPRSAAAIALIVDPATRLRVDPATVAAVLGLTPTESQLAVLLAEGRTVRDIAAAMDCSYASVRWHMRRIFAKLGVSRQVELVQAVLSLAGLPASGR